MSPLKSLDGGRENLLGDLNPLVHSATQMVRRNWGWFVVLGIVMILGGIFACIAAVSSTLVTVLFVGWLLVMGGIVQVIHSFAVKGFSGVLLNLLAGILYVVAGYTILRDPGMGAVALTVLMGAIFTMSGVYRAILASTIRFPQWGWLVASGVVSFALGLIVLGSLPQVAAWLLGFYVGIDLIVAGWWYAIAGFTAKSQIPLDESLRQAA